MNLKFLLSPLFLLAWFTHSKSYGQHRTIFINDSSYYEFTNTYGKSFEYRFILVLKDTLPNTYEEEKFHLTFNLVKDSSSLKSRKSFYVIKGGYDKGLKQGCFNYYKVKRRRFNKNDTVLLFQDYYLGGKKHGYAVSFFESQPKTKKRECFFLDNQAHGIASTYDKSGQIENVFLFCEGKLMFSNTYKDNGLEEVVFKREKTDCDFEKLDSVFFKLRK